MKFVSPRTILLVAPMMFSSGCSVGMALSGDPEPNISTLSVGQTRAIVIMNLGQPAQTNATSNGRVDVFHLERGNAPSVGRAVGHAALDVLTLGAWELIGTPIEGFAGEEFSVTVSYDEDDLVTKVESSPGHGAF